MSSYTREDMARAHVAQNHAIEGEARAIVAVYRKLLA